MKYYFEDNLLVFKLEGKLHKRIIFYNRNYRTHIKVRHPEMTMKKIEEIINDPDYIYKRSCKSKEYYYEKNILDETYRVVIESCKKHGKCIVTTYKVIEK